MVVGLCFLLTFFFVPETFWDRTPRPHTKTRRTGLVNISKIFHHDHDGEKGESQVGGEGPLDTRQLAIGHSASANGNATIAQRRQQKHAQHVGFADQAHDSNDMKEEAGTNLDEEPYVSGMNISGACNS